METYHPIIGKGGVELCPECKKNAAGEWDECPYNEIREQIHKTTSIYCCCCKKCRHECFMEI